MGAPVFLKLLVASWKAMSGPLEPAALGVTKRGGWTYKERMTGMLSEGSLDGTEGEGGVR